MAIMRSNPRSSDSIDFEHTATITDMEELLLAEAEHGRLGEEPAVRERLAADLSFLFPDAAARRPSHDVMNRKSRSGSQASPHSNVNEKIAVYKDTDCEPANNASSRADTSKLSTPCKRTKSGRTTMKSARDNHKDYSEAHLSMFEDDAIYQDSADHKHNSVLDASTLVQQLRDIATKRSSLLLHLKELQNEEQNILKSLTQATSATRNALPRRSSPSTPPPLPPRAPSSPRPLPLNAPHLPRPNLSPSRLPRIQPSKTSTKPLHTRTVSAPTLSTPVGAQRLAPRSGKRVPLGDKTTLEAKVGAQEVLGVGYTVSSQAHMPTVDAVGLAKESGLVFPDEERSFAGRKETRKVAMRFGEEDESMVGQGLGASGIGVEKMVSRLRGSGGSGRGGGGARNMGKNESRSRSRSRGRMPVGTTGSRRGCKVPRTILGKDWDF